MENKEIIKLEVQLKELLFQFEDFNHWVNRASEYYGDTGLRPSSMITIDSVGRICVKGLEFMRARDEGTFPIKVYSII